MDLVSGIIGIMLAFIASPLLYSFTFAKRFCKESEENKSISLPIRLMDWLLVNLTAGFMCFLYYYGIGAFLLSYGAAILLLRANRSLLAYQSNAQYGIRYESTLSFMTNSWIQIAAIVLLSPLVGIVLVVLSFIVGLIVSFIHEKIVISLFAALVSVIITNTLLTVIRLHFGKESTEEIAKKSDGLLSYVGDVKKTLTLLGLGTLICLVPIYFYTNIIDNHLKDKFQISFLSLLLL